MSNPDANMKTAYGTAGRIAGKTAALLALGLALAGCTADYLNRWDTVTLRAGDAVRQNLERETINPSKPSMYSTKGLGRDGIQIPEEPVAPTTSITLSAS